MTKDEQLTVSRYFRARSERWDTYREFIDPDKKIEPIIIMLLRTSFFVGIDNGVHMTNGRGVSIEERELNND
jgi:hypothetical protein